MITPTSQANRPLALLPYHTRLIAFLKRHDPDLWRWFASAKQRAIQAEEVRFDLLKSAYRIDRESQRELYQLADEVVGTLQLSAPITIYQAQNPAGLNASLVYLPDEIHLVMHGPIARQLTGRELRGLLGHELAHYLLWHDWNGDLLTAADMLVAFTKDSRAHPAHFATWRLLRLYNEIVCDRGALLVAGDVRDVISMLVKVETGVEEIDPDRYLRQADEICARGPTTTQGISHPEAFIRARAIKLWADADQGADTKITAMIETAGELGELDLLSQEVFAGWTRRVIDQLLAHKWFQTETNLAHARLYFEDYTPPEAAISDSTLASDIRLHRPSARDYFCFVLLDFVSSDRDLDEPTLAAALSIAEQLGIKDRYVELARQELRLRKNQLEKLDDRKLKVLEEADRAAAAAP